MLTITRYTKKFAHYLRNNKAVSALEYAILVGIIAVVIGIAITNFGNSMKTGIEKIGTAVKAPATKSPKADGS